MQAQITQIIDQWSDLLATENCELALFQVEHIPEPSVEAFPALIENNGLREPGECPARAFCAIGLRPEELHQKEFPSEAVAEARR